MKRYNVLAVSLGLVLATGALAACGSDSKESGSPAATSEGETEGTYAIVADAAVTKGLADTIAEMGRLTTAGAADDAAFDKVHELWESYEGTVKQNEPNDYLALEEALDSFKESGAAKDAAKMAEATSKFSTTAAGYLTKHPG